MRTASWPTASDADHLSSIALFSNLLLPQMHLATTTEPALWIGERVHPFAQDVGSIIPSGFAAYARVFHPAYRVGRDGTRAPVRWRDIAAANERSIQAEMRCLDISCEPARFSRHQKQPWDQQPQSGRLPYEIAERFVALLSRHTSTPESCWWPEDRAWCVATEIDFTWTYVGGTRECIQQVIDDPELEALTCVDVAISRGACVYPYAWMDASAIDFAKSVDAAAARSDRPSGRGTTSP
jgi:hypothetical protein